jgi:hypothetical protein
VVIKPKLRSILEVVGDLSDKDASTNVVDTSVARYAEDLSTEEVNDCLNELELLGLIKMLQRTRNRNMKGKKDGESFRPKYYESWIGRITVKLAENQIAFGGMCTKIDSESPSSLAYNSLSRWIRNYGNRQKQQMINNLCSMQSTT